MSVIISSLIILACILLILAVLIQNPKGGGLASGFTSGSQVMGVRRTADFLEKSTWSLVILIFVLSVAATPRSGVVQSQTNNKDLAKDKASKFNNTGGNSNNFNFAPGGGAPAGTGKR